jgi:hypothetical protein
MSPADIDRVFEPFARGSTAAGQAQGTGLGLTIAKMLTDLMGGELSVSSQPGQGTTFKARLFLPEVHATVSAPGTPTRVLPTPSDWGQARCIGYAGPRKQVLVVDNEEADRSLLQRWLAAFGF